MKIRKRVSLIVVLIFIGISFVLVKNGTLMPKEDSESSEATSVQMDEIENIQNQEDEVVTEVESEPLKEENDSAAVEVLAEEEVSYEYVGERINTSGAPLYEFTQSDFDYAKNSGDLVVLYYYASWCPACKKEFNNETIPAFDEFQGEGVVGFRVHYNDKLAGDSENMMAREYGVTYQHTKVFVRNGEQIGSRELENWSKDRYLNEIKEIL